jgi:hypothetical protein
MRLLPLLLAIGCIENSVNTKPDEPVFDPNEDTAPPFDTDTDTEPPPDTGEDSGIIVTDFCDSQDFAMSALPTREDCVGEEPANPAWELEQRWSNGSLGWMISSPVMVNLTDDNGNGRIDDGDVPDVVAAPYTTGIYAMNGSDGSIIWSVGSSQIEQSTPAVGDIDYDGFPEVFVQGLYGSKLISGVDGTTLWEGRAPSNIKTYCGGPGIADFEGDGEVELYFGRLILHADDGSTRGEGTGGQGTSIAGEGPISVAADIDLDGELELVAGNTVYNADGDTLWTMSGNDGFPAVGDFDSDPEGEVLISGQGGVRLHDDDGSQLWSYSFSGYGGPPAVADTDGDGLPEAIVPYQQGIVVLDVDGNVVWQYTHGSGTLYDGVSAYDFDGDGDWEVVLNGPSSIILFDGADGDIIDEVPTAGTYTCGQEPTMADVDNDGHADIAFSWGPSYGGSGGVTLLSDVDGFAAALGVWNQHQYSITNIGNDGEVPEYPEVNWEHINNFRAGPPISYVTVNQNLLGEIHDICTDDCDRDELTIWWSVGNDGTATVDDDVTVEIWGVTDTGNVLLHSELYTLSMPAGWMGPSVETRLTGIPHPLYDIYLSIDGGTSEELGLVSECVSSDNQVEWGAIVCL